MPRRKKKSRNRAQKYFSDSSSSDQRSFSDKRLCTQAKDKVHLNNSEHNSSTSTSKGNTINNDMNNSSQYTPMASTPNMNYPQNFSSFPLQSIPPYIPPPISPSIEMSLRELCQKMSNVEMKLTKLDRIEERLETMDKQFKYVDSEVCACKQRLNTLEQSAQFLSNVHDEYEILKGRIDTLTSGIESTKSLNNKVLDIETQSLEYNLLFFSIDEEPIAEETEENKVTDSKEAGHVIGGSLRDNENCMENILKFLEKEMKFEDAKSFKMEKAYRLGRRKDGADKPRPIVVRFSSLSDRSKVKNASRRLKDSKFGISPQYPREIVERRRKLVPIMLKERKKKKTAYIVGDKLYVNGELWEG